MPALHTTLVDVVLLNFKIQQFNLQITAGLLISWGIALIIGVLTRLIVGRRLPFGIIGTFIAALMGIWTTTEVILLDLPRDINLYGLSLFKALIGAIVFELIWYLVALRSYQVWAKRRQRKYAKKYA